MAYRMEMANPVRLASIVRFHLSELNARDAHHEFEHLARHLARARLYSNILPATGPVSAGGDRGRDFETFRTSISPQATVGSTFAGRSSQERQVVFACSLERRIEAKIRRDVKTTIAEGDADEIIYFCEANLPVAKRLNLIAEAKQAGVVLQVFDGIAIAEWLVEPDLFWIAEEFLHLPAEVGPETTPDVGYTQHRHAWRDRSVLPVSRADFVAVKAGLRTAVFASDARPDLSFWLDKMAAFLDGCAPRGTVRDAIYQIAVGHLRGRGDMTAQADLIANYFSDVEDHTSIGALTDAATLLNYSFSGYWLGSFRVHEADLNAHRQKVTRVIAENLRDPIGPGRRAGLLYVRGLLEHAPSAPGVTPDIATAVEYWSAMLDNADKAPLFPVEPFANFLTETIKHHGDDQALLALAARADELLAARLGNAAAGEKAYDRAVSLLDREDPTAAIRELHKAKCKWFSAERLGEVLSILLCLSEQYRYLGLAYAAKYFAMAAAFIARYEQRDGIGDIQPKALMELVDAEDAAGNSVGFLQLFPVLLTAHLQYDDQPLDPDKHDRLHENMGQLAALLGLLERGNPSARRALDELTAHWPAPIRHPIWTAADSLDGFWNKDTWPVTLAGLEEAMLDRPFGDLCAERHVRWQALGLQWTFVFANDYRTTPTAEQLVAELQLAACALARRDLGLVPTDVTIEIAIDPEADNLSIAEPDDEHQAFRVTLPTADRGSEKIAEVIAVFGVVVHSCSVLGDEALMRVFDQGLIESIFVARPYAELFREFVPKDRFAETIRLGVTPLELEGSLTSRAGNRVPWFDGPGPNYDPDRARDDVRNRYQRTLPTLRYTLERLIHSPKVRPRLERMHERGMKDWEILSILSNIAMNARLGERDDLSPEQWKERGLSLLKQAETPESALGTDLFTDDQIRTHANIYLGAFLSSWQLPWPPCVKLNELERFLVVRYRLREDDVDHPDIFGWNTPQLNTDVDAPSS